MPSEKSRLTEDEKTELLWKFAKIIDDPEAARKLQILLADQPILHQMSERDKAYTLVSGIVKRTAGWIVIVAGGTALAWDNIKSIVSQAGK